MKYALLVLFIMLWLVRAITTPVESPRVQVIQNYELEYEAMTTEDLEAWYGVDDLDELTN